MANPLLSVAISGAATGSPREAVGWAAGVGVRAVQLDAAMPGLRPRELGRSDRRGLASMLRRSELAFSGLDLWIPPAHFAEPSHADRAAAALLGAVGLASELTSLLPGSHAVVAVQLPANLPEATRTAFADAAAASEVTLADHAVHASPCAPAVCVGVDPASWLLAGSDPVAAAAADGTVSVRLSDTDGVSRVPAGVSGGRLDMVSLRAAVEVSAGVRTVVADPRGLREPSRVREAVERWRAAAPAV